MKTSFRLLAVAFVVLGLVHWSRRDPGFLLDFGVALGVYAWTQTTFDDRPIELRRLRKTLVDKRMPITIVGKIAGSLSVALIVLYFVLRVVD